jgi:Fic family protein
MSLTEILASIDQKKAQLDSYRPLSAAQVKSLKTLFDVDFSYNSTAIEGNTLTLQETRIVLLDGVTIGGKTTREHLEIINHKEAIDFIESLASAKMQAISKNDLLNIHNLVLRGIDVANAGKYREVPVYIRKKDGTIYKFCDPLHVKDEMDAFLDWIATPQTLHPVWFAAEVHTRFVSIHPFVDGNGRTARLLMNLALLQAGYAPAVLQVAKRNEYLDAIEEWQNGGGKEPLILLIAKSVDASLDIYLETIEKNVTWK